MKLNIDVLGLQWEDLGVGVLFFFFNWISQRRKEVFVNIHPSFLLTFSIYPKGKVSRGIA